MKRLLSSLVLGLIVIFVAASPGVFLPSLLVSALSFIALMEVYKAAGLEKNLTLFCLGFSMAFVFTYWHIFGMAPLSLLVFVYIALLLGCLVFFYPDLKLVDISKMFFLTIYICYFFGNLVFIKRMPKGNFYIWLVIFGATASDTFAYLIGRLFGRHKLMPVISPKKTVEGALGAVLGTILCFLCYGIVLMVFFKLSINLLLLSLLAIVVSIAAQFGDLAASVIKREYKIKDFGNIIPGHGGIMDRCDSWLFVAPAVFQILLHFENLIFLN